MPRDRRDAEEHAEDEGEEGDARATPSSLTMPVENSPMEIDKMTPEEHTEERQPSDLLPFVPARRDGSAGSADDGQQRSDEHEEAERPW